MPEFSVLVATFAVVRIYLICFIIHLTPIIKKRKPEKFFVHVYCDFESRDLDLMIEKSFEFEVDHLPHRVSSLK